MKGFFITGTDTGVGKTYFTALLTRALRQQSIPAIPLKPISAGDRSDSIILSEACGGVVSPAQMNPVHFTAPLSPYAASMLESRPFPWGILREKMKKLTENYPGPFLIEGAGGWRVPLVARNSRVGPRAGSSRYCGCAEQPRHNQSHPTYRRIDSSKPFADSWHHLKRPLLQIG